MNVVVPSWNWQFQASRDLPKKLYELLLRQSLRRWGHGSFGDELKFQMATIVLCRSRRLASMEPSVRDRILGLGRPWRARTPGQFLSWACRVCVNLEHPDHVEQKADLPKPTRPAADVVLKKKLPAHGKQKADLLKPDLEKQRFPSILKDRLQRLPRAARKFWPLLKHIENLNPNNLNDYLEVWCEVTQQPLVTRGAAESSMEDLDEETLRLVFAVIFIAPLVPSPDRIPRNCILSIKRFSCLG